MPALRQAQGFASLKKQDGTSHPGSCAKFGWFLFFKECTVAQDQKHFLAEIEEKILTSWEKEKTFEKSVENRRGAEFFSFNDGPPFANGLPHFGHSLVTAIKD